MSEFHRIRLIIVMQTFWQDKCFSEIWIAAVHWPRLDLPFEKWTATDDTDEWPIHRSHHVRPGRKTCDCLWSRSIRSVATTSDIVAGMKRSDHRSDVRSPIDTRSDRSTRHRSTVRRMCVNSNKSWSLVDRTFPFRCTNEHFSKKFHFVQVDRPGQKIEAANVWWFGRCQRHSPTPLSMVE